MSEGRACVAVVVAFKLVCGSRLARLVDRRWFADDSAAVPWLNRRRGSVPPGWGMVAGCRLYVPREMSTVKLLRKVRQNLWGADRLDCN